MDARAKIAIASAAKSLRCCAVRPPTGESASARLNEIAFTYGDERATLATLIRGTGPRWLRRLAIGWPQDNASERSAERSPIVEARWWRWRCSTPAVSSASERKAEAHRPPYLRDGISTVNPGLPSSSFGHGSLVFLGLSEQGAHICRGRADAQ